MKTYNILQAISVDLNQYLNKKLLISDKITLLSEPMNFDVSQDPSGINKIVFTLLKFEQDHALKKMPQGGNAVSKPTANWNLWVLCSFCYPLENYDEALKMLDLTCDYFQEKSVFTPGNTPSLEPDISKVVVEMVNLNMEEMSQLWTILGARHLPYILYKFRVQ